MRTTEVTAADREAKPSPTCPQHQSIEWLAIVGFLVLFAVGNYLLPMTQGQRLVWTNLFWTAASFGAAIRCLVTARGLDGPARRAWILFGLGCALWFAGMVIWSYQELVIGAVTPFPGLSDVGFQMFAVFFGAGLIFLTGERLRTPVTLLEISQFGIFLSCIVLAHIVIFAPLLIGGAFTPGYVMTALSYPVMYMTLLAYSVAMLLRRNHIASGSLGLIIGAIAMHAITDSFYAYELLEGNYQAGSHVDIMWLIAFSLIYLAATRYHVREDAMTGSHGIEVPQDARARLIPMISVLLTAIIVLAFRDRLTADVYPYLVVPVVLLMLFGTLREWANSTIEARLSAINRASEERLRRVFDISPAMIGIFRQGDGGIIDVNEACAKTIGYSRDELIGISAAKAGFWHQDEDRERFNEILHSGNAVRGQDIRIRSRSGESRDLLISCSPVSIGTERCLLVAAQDITERQRTAAQVRKLAQALEQSADMVIITDCDQSIEYVNPAFERITGYDATEVRGRHLDILDSGMQQEDFHHSLQQRMRDGDIVSDVFINRTRGGDIFYEQRTITPLRDDGGRITHYVATGRDITEQVRSEERLRYLASHDSLTMLPNRSQLLDRLQMMMAAACGTSRRVAVMFLDLDRFKNINDTLGHDVGDALLRELGQRLHDHLRSHDAIARFGGDEFVIIMNDIGGPDDAGGFAMRMLTSLSRPFETAERRLHVSASIGISLYPDDSEDAGGLLRHADAAMYRAKEQGGNRYQFYSADIGAHAKRRLTLENQLRHALENGEFRLHYQPQVDGRSGRIVGCEALLRWQHPEQGLVPPAEFVPLLEETGLIVPIGQWVLEQACGQLDSWRQEHGGHLVLAVNVSGRQFLEPGFVDGIEAILDRHGIPARQLELEITETTLMQHLTSTDNAFRRLVGMGVGIALDDFGTGYSSLGYLRRFPINTLKVDRSFVTSISDNDDNNAEIANAIIALGHSLGLWIVAEGVETEAQRRHLVAHGCTAMQGFLFGRPMAATEFANLLTEVREAGRIGRMCR